MVRRRSFGPAHCTIEPKARSGRPGFAARGSPKFRLGRVESPVRATVVSAPPDREAPGFRPKHRSRPGFCSEISVDHRDFKPKLRRGATETSAPDGAALHRGSGRVAPEAARHARRRSARSPPPSAGTPAADHAAALWQLCCRIGHTTTVACQAVGSRSSCHRLQTATGAGRCANAGTAQRARNGRRAYPANRHHVCTCRRSCVRRLTISIPIGAAFGYDTRTHTLRRTPIGRGPIPAA